MLDIPASEDRPAAVVVLRPMSLDEFISLQHHESKQRGANIGDPRIITAPLLNASCSVERRRKPNSPTRRRV